MQPEVLENLKACTLCVSFWFISITGITCLLFLKQEVSFIVQNNQRLFSNASFKHLNNYYNEMGVSRHVQRAPKPPQLVAAHLWDSKARRYVSQVV